MTDIDIDPELESAIAIVGMACRFPGAPDARAYWENLRAGTESIARFSADEAEQSPLLPADLHRREGFVGAIGEVSDAGTMDYEFFGLSPRDAGWMDPQQRVFLECAWHALEDAGCNPFDFAGRISVYAGAGQSGHLVALLGAMQDGASVFQALGTATGESLAMRVAHKLRLRGEAISIYTACSTSLVAGHLACQSLLLGQSDFALAGGVRIAWPQRTGYVAEEGLILSPDGHCRAFDADARGTVPANGAGIVVLRRFDEALRAGDRIYAVIRGSAVNNDADQKVGFTAPSVQGQSQVIRDALAYAGVSADEIDYVEAHGTGTAVGDPIEIAALTQAFRSQTSRRGYCALGSVKTNFGHLDTAAGVAGLMKTALSLHHGCIPASLHFREPHPAISFDETPFFVNAALRPWPRDGRPRRAAVSSFGIGGTNAHAILEEAPAPPHAPSTRPQQLVLLSARTPTALREMCRELRDHVAGHPELPLEDVAYTLSTGRVAFSCRRAIVASTREDLVAQLGGSFAAVRAPASGVAAGAVFMFPGFGMQWAGMARGLYREPLFAGLLDDCTEQVRTRTGVDVRALLLAESPGPLGIREALLCLFALEYALTQLFGRLGVAPAAAVGHSFGEYVAACLAGVFTLAQAIELANLRGHLMEKMPPGAMLGVALSEHELRAKLPSDLSVASVNGPGRCVVSGPPDSIAALERRVALEGVKTVSVHADHAYHSRDVEPLMAPLTAAIERMRPAPPSMPFVSCLTGTWIEPAQAADPLYWANQMREPVRLQAGLETLAKGGYSVFLEVGPGQSLTSSARSAWRDAGDKRVIPSMPRPEQTDEEWATFAGALGALWTRGLPVSWNAFYEGERRGRVGLPGYRFQRKPCSLSATATATATAPAPDSPIDADEEDARLYVAPSDVTEERLAAVFGQALGRDRVSMADSLLGLGGDSLTALQISRLIRKDLRAVVSPQQVLLAPAVAHLAEIVRAAPVASETETGPALTALPRQLRRLPERS